MVRSRPRPTYSVLCGVASAICLLVANCQSGGPPGGDGPDDDDTNGGTGNGGAPHNIDALQAAVADETTWRAAYECQFVDESHALLP